MKRKTVLRVITISVIVILGSVISWFMIYSKYSQPAKIGKENRENIEKIEIGMTVDEVNYIMGDPDSIYTIRNSSLENYGKEVYSYYRGQFIYGYLQVIFEPGIDTVIDVINFIE